MPWGIAASAVVGLYSASQQSKAAKAGANTQAGAANAATAEQQRQFDLSRQDQQPWMQAGQGALTQMQALNAGDFSSFKSSPDYTYARDQMQQGVERGAANRGSLYSGGTSVDLATAMNGIASQNYGNYYDRLSRMAGQGQSTASGLGSLGANMANQVGQNLQSAGQARASAYGQVADANSQFAAGVGGAFNDWYQQKQASQAPAASSWYTGGNSNGYLANMSNTPGSH